MLYEVITCSSLEHLGQIVAGADPVELAGPRGQARGDTRVARKTTGMSGTFCALTPLGYGVDSSAGTTHWCGVPSLIHGEIV